MLTPRTAIGKHVFALTFFRHKLCIVFLPDSLPLRRMLSSPITSLLNASDFVSRIALAILLSLVLRVVVCAEREELAWSIMTGLARLVTLSAVLIHSPSIAKERLP